MNRKESLKNSLKIGVFLYNYVFFILAASFFGREYSTAMLTSVSFILLFILLFEHFKASYGQYLVFIFFIFNMVAFFVFNYFFGGEHVNAIVHDYQLKVLLFSVLNMMLAIVLYENIKNNYFYRVMLLSLLLLVTFVLVFFDYQTMRYPFAYQLVGAVLPIFSLFVVANTSNKYFNYLVFFVAGLILYYLKSRAAFYGFFIVFCLFFMKNVGVKFLVLLLVMMLIAFFFNINYEVVSLNQRMLGIDKVTQDKSFIERVEQFKFGLIAIKDNWFWGQYGGQVIVHEGAHYPVNIGSYMHNALSFWRQYGLVFFVVFSAYYSYLLFRLFILWVKSVDTEVDFSFYLGALFFIYLLFFYSYSYYYIWFVFMLMHLVVRKKLSEDL